MSNGRSAGAQGARGVGQSSLGLFLSLVARSFGLLKRVLMQDLNPRPSSVKRCLTLTPSPQTYLVKQ